MELFENLREKYAYLSFDKYDYSYDNDKIYIKYCYSIAQLDSFETSWVIPFNCMPDYEIFDRLVFSLGVCEAISYYKICCPKKFIIRCGSLDNKQISFWKKLFFLDLGEFLYRNQISISQEELLDIVCNVKDFLPCFDSCHYEGCLVPIDGGKNSIVSLNLLKGEDLSAFVININQTILNVLSTFGISTGLVASRKLDDKILYYNSQGFLNGHTPFSDVAAFSSYLCAYLNRKKYVVLSYEVSVNESSVPDTSIILQYSNSFEFEKDFSEYMSGLTSSDIHYFSLLRPFNELQIALLFSQYDKYFPVFRSCNQGSKTNSWCCNCAKCLFVYIILSPFIEEDILIQIFGKKLLDLSELENDFRCLIGIDDNKPFEYVGNRREVLAALLNYCVFHQSYLTDKYFDFIIDNAVNVNDILGEFSFEHNIPKAFLNKMKRAFESWL